MRISDLSSEVCSSDFIYKVSMGFTYFGLSNLNKTTIDRENTETSQRGHHSSNWPRQRWILTKLACSKKNGQEPTWRTCPVAWYQLESNQRHKDFQSFFPTLQ